MKKTFLIFILIAAVFNSLIAQQKVTVKMPVPESTEFVTLAHYQGYRQFLKVDSAKVENGLITFEEKDTPWKGGVYMVVLSPSKYFDFLLSGTEKNIYMEFDTTDYVGTVQFKHSPENEFLFSYRKYLADISKQAGALQAEMSKETNPELQNRYRVQLGEIQKNMDSYIREKAAERPGSFASKIMKANLEPKLPEKAPILANGKEDSTFMFRTYKAHFFDDLDFSDERMLRTPFLESKVEKYFNNLVYQKTDSLKKEADYVLALASQDKEVYRYVLWYLTNKYENTDIVGLDGVVIHLYENHYLKNGDWLDADQRKRFEDRLKTIKPLETGKVIPELILHDLEGKEHNLKDVKAKYTIVNFYSPTCGHCKDAAPVLAKFNDEHKDKGLVVWNVSTSPERDLKEVADFVKTYGTERMLNLYDKDYRYSFIDDFDVYATPTLYILDEQKRIIGRRIPVEDLDNYIEYYENNMR